MMYSRLLCMIIKPNKFLTISFFLAGASQGLNAVLMGAKVRWKTTGRAHSTGLHFPLKLCVSSMSLGSANVVEAVSISHFPYRFGSLQARSLGQSTWDWLVGLSQRDWDLLVPQEWEMKSSCNGRSSEFGLLNGRGGSLVTSFHR